MNYEAGRVVIIKEVSEEEIREIQMVGAYHYRQQERTYRDALDEREAISEDPNLLDIIPNPIQARYEIAITASQAFHHLRRIREQFSLVVGGMQGEYILGREYPYDPSEHTIGSDPSESKPEVGEAVYVAKSQISRLVGQEEDVLLNPVFKRSEPVIVFYYDDGDELTTDIVRPLARSSDEPVSPADYESETEG